jgi:hypothetical protein
MKIDTRGIVLLVIGLISGVLVFAAPDAQKAQMGAVATAALVLFCVYTIRLNK